MGKNINICINDDINEWQDLQRPVILWSRSWRWGTTGFHFSQGKGMVQLNPTQHLPLDSHNLKCLVCNSVSYGSLSPEGWVPKNKTVRFCANSPSYCHNYIFPKSLRNFLDTGRTWVIECSSQEKKKGNRNYESRSSLEWIYYWHKFRLLHTSAHLLDYMLHFKWVISFL